MQCDVLIIGGGLVGASLAVALKRSGLSIIVVEAYDSQSLRQKSFDARSIALADASKNILDGLELWSGIKKVSTPIKTIHVSKKSAFGHTSLNADKHKKFAFGYVSEIGDLNQEVQLSLEKQQNVLYISPAKLTDLIVEKDSATAKIEKGEKLITIESKIVVAADGTNSWVRKLLNIMPEMQDYKQSAVVANIGLRRTHSNVAYERFTSTGLIALLPMSGHRSSLVWATSPNDAKRIFELSKDDFLKELQQQFGYRLGRFEKVGKRGLFPLKLQYMKKSFNERVVFIGNASQTLHPVAGQGFNLGLRDVAILAELIISDGIDSPEKLFEKYQEMRELDKKQIINSTGKLVKFFGSTPSIINFLQSLSLLAVDNISILQEILVHRAMGYSQQNSKLACGIPLRDSL